MAITDELDITPPFTISTVQFKNEVLNTLTSSLLAVFILINIGSAVSKLMYFQRRSSFSYQSWIRAFIFANSDDPLRIFSWLCRRYIYRDPTWLRAPNRLRTSRLVIPLCARLVIFLTSIASIAITIPGERRLEGCARGDFKLNIDPTRGERATRSTSVCEPIPLESTLGSVRSTAFYCACQGSIPIEPIPDIERTVLQVRRWHEEGLLYIDASNRNEQYNHQIYVEWRTPRQKFVSYRSRVIDFTLERFADVVVNVTQQVYPECEEERRDPFRTKEGIPEEADGEIEGMRIEMKNCDLDARALSEELEAFVRHALVLTKEDQVQPRIRFRKDIGEREETRECPLDVVVTRPIVNIIPLLLTLLAWFLVNVLVSYAVSQHGNALDAGFHIIKEALGHDCTSNPLEENIEKQEILEVDLYQWVCASTGGGHVGFIGREGDTPVDEFPEGTKVGGCGKAASELAGAHIRAGSPYQSQDPAFSNPHMGKPMLNGSVNSTPLQKKTEPYGGPRVRSGMSTGSGTAAGSPMRPFSLGPSVPTRGVHQDSEGYQRSSPYAPPYVSGGNVFAPPTGAPPPPPPPPPSSGGSPGGRYI